MSGGEMRHSWLVQRLHKPRSGGLLGPDNPFAFGGGLRSGGLTADAMAALRGVFTFDYMGAAEFEFGAVPEALSGLARSAGNLVAGSFRIALTDVAANWHERDAQAPDGNAEVYFIGRHEHAAEIESRVREWAAEGYRAKLKEATRLDVTLRPYNDFDGLDVGWLELDNGFFVFTDREMWEQTAALFGVTIDAAVTK